MTRHAPTHTDRRALTFLVTAGPTVEDLDPVRFISNRATGRLGFEVARAARAAGHRVILIHGPVPEPVRNLLLPPAASLAEPRGRGPSGGARPALTLCPVRSSAEMHRAVLAALARAQVVVMTAAVADFTPARISRVKLKKARLRRAAPSRLGRATSSRADVVLRLKPTVDILAHLGRVKRARRPDLVLVGFALETGAGGSAAKRLGARLAEARRKLAAKNLDVIVLDTPEEMGAARGEFYLLRAGQARPARLAVTKGALAKRLVRLGEELRRPPVSRRQGPCRRS